MEASKPRIFGVSSDGDAEEVEEVVSAPAVSFAFVRSHRS